MRQACDAITVWYSSAAITSLECAGGLAGRMERTYETRETNSHSVLYVSIKLHSKLGRYTKGRALQVDS